MNQPKMSPAVLRLLVIFPNLLSYVLLFGLVIYVITNYAFLSGTGAIKIWAIFIAILAPMSGYTTYSIVKRIRAGVL